MQENYQEFLESKRIVNRSVGVDVTREDISSKLFPFQRDLVYWALRKGRAAIFADTGLGKSAMQLEWASRAADRVLILAPLAVAHQTVNEGQKFGINVTYARTQKDAAEHGITIANYEMMEHFDPAQFGGVVLDESSILKSFDGKMRTRLIELFSATPMRLCCTATPAPNDIAEIANHAEFLGIMTRVEMLASFFIHDDKGWRLKGHASQAFYRWMASWGMSVRKPSDLGYADDGYVLPGLNILPHIIETSWRPEGQLFATALHGITERSEVRKATIADRIQRAAELINADPAEQWLAWVGLNDEGRELVKLIPGAVLVEGADKPDAKADALRKFAAGEVRVLITKPSIAGFGMNFQSCASMVFVGLGDSYEEYYQAIRRCYRFGQQRVVSAHIILTEPERVIYDNVLRKEKEAMTTASELIKHVAEFERGEIAQTQRQTDNYKEADVQGNGWHLMLGDSTERIKEVASDSVGLSVFSPPFSHLYTYSNSERDLGNSANYEEFFGHMGFITRELLRITMPGRNACVHVQQLPTTKATDGVIGMKDFRGDMIKHFVENGWIYHGEICIDKDPQAQAIRTHSKSLLFVQLRKDSSWMRPAFADYILIFRKPGDNTEPVKTDLTNEEWIEYARPIWYGIKESDTLNAAAARSEEDERHICPLQLGTIERCVRLWSNKGDTVFTPFLGIGSEVYTAIKNERKGVGIELKPEYFAQAVKNVRGAERYHAVDLFSLLDAQPEEVPAEAVGD